AGDGRDVDDRAASALEERQRRMRRAHARHQVYVDADAPAFLVVAAAEARRVVDQNVDAAECRCCVLHVLRDGGGVRAVAVRGVHFVAFRLELALALARRFGAARADRDVGSAVGESERDRAADAAAPPPGQAHFFWERDFYCYSLIYY